MTIRKTLLGAAGVAAFALAAAPASAEEREFSWSITAGGTSDYIFRGTSLSDNDPAAQGSIDIGYGIFYAGAWASNLGTDDSYGTTAGPWELDLYAGFKPVWGPVTFDFGTILYLYPAEEIDDFTYVEFKAGGSMELVKSLTGGVTFYYTPDQSNYFEGWTVEGSLSYSLPQWAIFEPALSGGVGYSVNEDPASFGLAKDDYVYWNAGLSLTVEKFTMDFRYWDTNISDSDNGGNGNFFAGERFADERFVFSAKVTLP